MHMPWRPGLVPPAAWHSPSFFLKTPPHGGISALPVGVVGLAACLSRDAVGLACSQAHALAGSPEFFEGI
jgi:hypothetical protein